MRGDKIVVGKKVVGQRNTSLNCYLIVALEMKIPNELTLLILCFLSFICAHNLFARFNVCSGCKLSSKC